MLALFISVFDIFVWRAHLEQVSLIDRQTETEQRVRSLLNIHVLTTH